MSDSKDLWELGQVKGRQDERERIIAELEKLRPYVNDKGQVVFATFDTLLAVVERGANK